MSDVIRSTPATFWQRLTTDYDSLTTVYKPDFASLWSESYYSLNGDYDKYRTYIIKSDGKPSEFLGKCRSRQDALRFHEEMVVKYGFFEGAEKD